MTGTTHGGNGKLLLFTKMQINSLFAKYLVADLLYHHQGFFIVASAAGGNLCCFYLYLFTLSY
jgi:hypothetical protein